jgi:DNA polymerase-3 subunit epsilon
LQHSRFKLEYIAYKYNFFYKGHRAIIDCLAGVHVLAQELIITKQSVLKQLLSNALTIRFKLYAIHSPFESKDLLKARGYRWSNGQDSRYKAWYMELTEDKVEEEIGFLRLNVYKGLSITFPVEILDSYSRFSIHYDPQHNDEKYSDKIEWFNILCKDRPCEKT